MKFDDIMKVIFKVEGGLSEDPNDPGRTTKYGISLKAFPDLGESGIKKLSKNKAKNIYRKNYWAKAKVSSFPFKTRLAVMDTAVNHGRYAQLIQKAVNSTGTASLVVDGIIGPKTLGAVKALSNDYFLEKLLYERLKYYRSLDAYKYYAQTWERRLYTIALYSRII